MKRDGPEIVDADPEILDDVDVQEKFMAKASRFAKKLPFVRDVCAFYFAVRDPDVPIHKKGLLTAAVVYFISPIDLVPDVIGVLGFADDAIVAKIVLSTVSDILTEEHYNSADDLLGQERRGLPSYAGGTSKPDASKPGAPA